MGWIFPVNYRCRVDRDDDQGVFQTIWIGSAKTVAMAPPLCNIRHFPDHIASLTRARQLIGKAVSRILAFACQTVRCTVLTKFTLNARLW